MSDIRKCEVCGKEREVHVRSSACGPISFAYCEECLKCGAEPYGALVSYLACACISDTTELNKGYVQSVVEPTLRVANKNNADLEADLKSATEEMNKYYDEMNAIALRQEQEMNEPNIEKFTSEERLEAFPDVDIDLTF